MPIWSFQSLGAFNVTAMRSIPLFDAVVISVLPARFVKPVFPPVACLYFSVNNLFLFVHCCGPCSLVGRALGDPGGPASSSTARAPGWRGWPCWASTSSSRRASGTGRRSSHDAGQPRSSGGRTALKARRTSRSYTIFSPPPMTNGSPASGTLWSIGVANDGEMAAPRLRAMLVTPAAAERSSGSTTAIV